LRSRGQVEFYLQADLDPIRFQFGEDFVGSMESLLRFDSSRVRTEGDDDRGRLGRWLGRGCLLGRPVSVGPRWSGEREAAVGPDSVSSRVFRPSTG
jgi:hypothetical protein